MDKIGKAKGMFQLAWERGFIDQSLVKNKKDEILETRKEAGF